LTIGVRAFKVFIEVTRTRTLIVIVVALAFTGMAAGATGSLRQDMQTAVRALNYPKAGALKVSCHGASTYRCVATYRHHRHRVFYASWHYEFGQVGWICAGPSAANCKLLRRTFVTNARAGDGTAEMASRGYMAIHYNDPQPYIGQDCPKKPAPVYTFCYAGNNNTSFAVYVTLKKVKTGYIVSVTSKVVPTTNNG
jgi:hypothetical protein